MKKIFYIIATAFLLLFLSSCLTTLYPIFHSDEAIYNESLLGYWKCADKDKKISYMEFREIPADRRSDLPPAIQEISGKGYFVSQISSLGDITDQYFVFLVKIGKNYYLDYYPAEMASQKNVTRFYKEHFIKFHSNYRCDFKDNNN